MLRDPQSDRPPLRVLQHLRDFARGRQNERIGPGRQRLDQAIRPVINTGIDTDLGKIGANQREIMLFVRLPNSTNSVNRLLVTNMAAKRVA